MNSEKKFNYTVRMYVSSNHIFLLILFILNVIHILAADGDSECTKWNEYCDAAKKQNNPNFQCIEDSVFYFEPNGQPWNKARQLCSEKFDGSYWADLVGLSRKKKKYAEQMMSKLTGTGIITEIATNGVCCMRKTGDTTVESKCQWLSSGSSIIELGPLSPADDSCQIVTVEFDKNAKDREKFKNPKLVNKFEDPKHPYLCSYNIPDGCSPNVETPATTTTSSTTSTTVKTSVKSSDECKRWEDSCRTANSQWNVNDRCIEKTVFHFESKADTWDKAKNLCSQRFYFSHLANLVELSSNQKSNVNRMISVILEKYANNTVEIFTNGMCCHQKIEGINATQGICQWLSNGEKINEFPDKIEDNKCHVLSVTMKSLNGSVVYTNSKYVDTIGGISLPYLCTYNAPENCL